MTDLTENGLGIFAELMGAEGAAAMRATIATEGFAGDVARLAADFAFGSIWSRDGLERKQRSLVTIGILIAQRQTQELKNHFRIGLANGLTQREIEEAVIQAIPYCGFPAAAGATVALQEVLREKGMGTETPTARERGLL